MALPNKAQQVLTTRIDGFPLFLFVGYITEFDKQVNQNTGKETIKVFIFSPYLTTPSSFRTLTKPEDVMSEDIPSPFNLKLNAVSDKLFLPRKDFKIIQYKRPYLFLAALKPEVAFIKDNNKNVPYLSGNLHRIFNNLQDAELEELYETVLLPPTDLSNDRETLAQLQSISA